MNLTFTFQISVYLLVTLSSIMFMMAEGGLFPQLLTIPLGLLTLFFTDRWDKFSLSPLWANILGLLAFLIVCAEFFSDIEGRLLSGAHFLVYLTWIILLQKKSDTQYWWLCALGFLQIAVGAVLTESGYYGTLLVVYLFLSIWTLSVFSLYRTRNTFLQHQHTTSPMPRLNVEHAAVTTSPFQQASQVQGGVQSDQSRHWLTSEFFWATVGCSVTALAISMCFFLLIPRLWVNRSFFNNETVQAGNKPLVGFSEKVQLGEMGEILESSEIVLEVAIYDNETDEPVPVDKFAREYDLDEPLFRGTVLSDYENGSWSKVRYHRGNRTRPDFRPNWSEELQYKELYRQEYVLEPIGTRVLFVMQPYAAMDMLGESENSLNSETGELRQRRLPEKDKTTRYNLFTAKEADRNDQLTKLYRRRTYLQLPQRDLKKLIRFTRDLIAEHPELKTDAEKARFIESHLRDSGEFSYTLNMSIEDPTIDPVEDFLFNRKSGHCEYYASALALMLRAIGIPTRVITGFKGGEQKYLSNQYQVQQRHAHSWVEAYLDDHWVTMDATPALQRAELVAQNAASFSSWRGASKMLTQFWHDYVIGVSFQRQKRAFYDPIIRAGKKLANQLIDIRTTISAAVSSIRSFLSSPRRWFSWEGGAAVFVIAGIFFAVKWLFKVSLRLFRRLFRKESGPEGALNSADVAFYERFQNLLAQKGFVRGRSETQMEFSGHVQDDLSQELSNAEITEYPDQVTDFYYQVRYGHHVLKPDQTEEIQQKLAKLESVLVQDEETEN